MIPNLTKAKSAVLTVGKGGRGFVIKSRGEHVVVTAAHCLPFLPPPHGMSYTKERTYSKLLGPLGKKPTIWAECFFADPVADIAVIGSPDNQSLSDEADAFEALIDPIPPLAIADPPEKGHTYLLSLNGEWFECTFTVMKESQIWIDDTAQEIVGGMSGSPILLDNGKAVGLVCLGGTPPHLCPRLVRDLPRRFLQPRRRAFVRRQ